MKEHDYTVVLIYPDYVANQYGEEFYVTWTTAGTVERAVEQAQKEASEAQGYDVVARPYDFAAVSVFQGHHKDLWAGRG